MKKYFKSHKKLTFLSWNSSFKHTFSENSHSSIEVIDFFNLNLLVNRVGGFCKLSFHIYFLSSCQLFCIQGCVALEELYLSHNGITKMEGLSSLVNLRVLDVSSNKLTSVDDILNLTQYVYSSISLSTSNLLFPALCL